MQLIVQVSLMMFFLLQGKNIPESTLYNFGGTAGRI